MNVLKTLGILFCIALISCGAPKMDAKLINSITAKQTAGVIAGISVGDNKADVKGKINSGWEMEESGNSLVYSKTWDNFNFAKLTIDLNSQSQVHALTFALSGEGENVLLLADAYDNLKSNLDGMLTESSDNSWDYSAPNGDDCFVTLNTNEEPKASRMHLSLNVVNSGTIQ